MDMDTITAAFFSGVARRVCQIDRISNIYTNLNR